MILFINTMGGAELSVALYAKDGTIVHKREVSVSYNESEQLLKTIDEMRGMHLIEGIIVVSQGEGRFSALRTGVACANALAFAWNVPIFGIKMVEEVKEAIKKIVCAPKLFNGSIAPLYAREPNIISSGHK